MMKVSVIVPTYNHEKYIKTCLDGILSQKTSFKFEILVGEDESSDSTRDIVRKYELEYPDKIKVFYNDRKNVIYVDGYPTGRANLVNLLKSAKGKYVAICEGDDYWTNTLKLQKQVDFLDNNFDFSICFHDAIWFDGDKQFLCSKLQETLQSGKDIFELRDLLKSNFIPTASVVFRNKLVQEFPDWYIEFPFADWPLHILNAVHGKIKYIAEPMSVYRVHNSSLWSSKSLEYRYISSVNFQFFINRYFDFAYDDIIKESIIKQLVGLLKENNALQMAFEKCKKSPISLLDLLRQISEKKIVVFGSGSAGQKAHSCLPVKVSYFLDNDSRKWGQIISGIVVKEPIEMLKEEKDKLAILICSTYFSEITEQLKEMGFEENKHFWNLYLEHSWLFN